jgi:hypothetical protein
MKKYCPHHIIRNPEEEEEEEEKKKGGESRSGNYLRSSFEYDWRRSWRC